MATHEDANLILKLYELRREARLREARDWFASTFRPQTAKDVADTLMSDKGAYLRMVASYWEMSAALVNHGTVDADLFRDTNGEYFLVYAAIEPFIQTLRDEFSNPGMFKNLEKLVNDSPKGAESVKWWQDRWKAEAESKRNAANA